MKKTYSVLLVTGHIFEAKEELSFFNGRSIEQDGTLFFPDSTAHQSHTMSVTDFSFERRNAIAFFN